MKRVLLLAALMVLGSIIGKLTAFGIRAVNSRPSLGALTTFTTYAKCVEAKSMQLESVIQDVPEITNKADDACEDKFQVFVSQQRMELEAKAPKMTANDRESLIAKKLPQYREAARTNAANKVSAARKATG